MKPGDMVVSVHDRPFAVSLTPGAYDGSHTWTGNVEPKDMGIVIATHSCDGINELLVFFSNGSFGWEIRQLYGKLF